MGYLLTCLFVMKVIKTFNYLMYAEKNGQKYLVN